LHNMSRVFVRHTACTAQRSALGLELRLATLPHQMLTSTAQ
jgi:hypothetical protein